MPPFTSDSAFPGPVVRRGRWAFRRKPVGLFSFLGVAFSSVAQFMRPPWVSAEANIMPPLAECVTKTDTLSI